MTDRKKGLSEGPLPTESTTSDVLVIGAGVAGLAAAREMSASGLSVIVLEARNRIGGRIFTIRDNNSAVPIELGAEFVHGRSPEILALVHEARLMLCEVPERHWQLYKGLLIKSAQFWSELEAIMNKMKRVRKRDLSFKAFLDEYCR
jgi:monoamine oxidase